MRKLSGSLLLVILGQIIQTTHRIATFGPVGQKGSIDPPSPPGLKANKKNHFTSGDLSITEDCTGTVFRPFCNHE